MMTQEQINQTQKEAKHLLYQATRYHAMSEVTAYCMCGASLCLIVDMVTGKIVDMPRLSSFWTVAFLLLMFIFLLWYTDRLRQKLGVLHDALGFVAHDVTVNIPTE